MDVFALAASITLDTTEYENALGEASGKTHSFGEKLKSGLATAAKAGAAAIGAATAAVGALAKAALDSYGDYEQLTGGVETLFKTSADVVMEYANNAYKTAGLSANEYMETVTSFSASLLQSLGGDTEAAAKYADMAITDMSDNANKMGTDMEMIQNAYNGFAKQNFTMLDNLKLGYGGTKEEMQRLLSDAEKISGIEYDISSYADIVDAIHVVQTEMGITGTTAAEASSTIQGSVSAAKSAWANLVTGIGDENANLDQLIANFVDSVGTAGENIIPRVEQILVGIGATIQKLAPIIGEQLPPLMESVLPSLLSAGGQLLSGLANGILAAAPGLIKTGLPLISSLVSGLASALPEIANSGVDIITTLADGLSEQLPTLVPVAIDAILQLATTLTDPDNLSNMVDSALQLIMSLADGLINALPKLIEKVPVIITNLVTAIANNLPKLLQSGIKLIIKLGEGLIKAIPQLIKNIPQIIRAIVEGFLNLGSEILGIGRNIVSGIWNGIKEKIEWLKNKVKGFFGGILDGAKDFLGIKSPSKLFRDQVGQYIALGVAEGIEDKQDDAVKAAEKLAKNVYSKSKDWAERQTREQKLSLEEQLEVWEAIQSQFIKESKQYADAEKKVFELREQIQDEYYKKVESIHKDIDALESNYQNTLAERTQEIFNSYKLFDEIPQRQKVSGDDLISNLQGQISTIEEFYSGLNELAARGIGESLIADIRKMGPSAVDELSALLALSDEKLSEYAGLYEEKQALANSVAVGELGELKKETDRKIRENLDALGKLYDTQAPDVGTAFTDGLAKGIRNGMSKVIQSAVSVAQAAVTAVQSTLGGTPASAEFAGMVDSMTSGLGSGLDSQLAEIQKTAAAGISFETADVKSSGPNMGAVLSAVMHGMNSINSMNSGMTIPITLEMDGDVLVQKTYRLYQNESSRVGPAMVRV